MFPQNRGLLTTWSRDDVIAKLDERIAHHAAQAARCERRAAALRSLPVPRASAKGTNPPHGAPGHLCGGYENTPEERARQFAGWARAQRKRVVFFEELKKHLAGDELILDLHEVNLLLGHGSAWDVYGPGNLPMPEAVDETEPEETMAGVLRSVPS